ncbi:CsbD family protein [Streptomyces sp. NPDC060194]|uniref:CsbD family protein n=1 Tax=Streptomyces sp. NPDC060194 TaxID=3347069 RepID=UPI00365BB889
MSDDKGTFDQLKGKAKEAAGTVGGDERLKSEGRTDQAQGRAKEAVENVKDKLAGMKDSLGGKKDDRA